MESSPAAPSLPTVDDRLDIGWAARVADDDSAFPADERLARACVSGDPVQARLAVAQGADPSRLDALGRTPLMYAAKFGHRELVAYLCSLGVDVDAQRPTKNWGWPQHARPLMDIAGGTALMECAMHGDTAIARILLGKGADVGKSGHLKSHAALFHAAHEGHADMLDLLLEKAGDTIPLDWEYQPVLSYAVRRNHRGMVERMLDRRLGLDGAAVASALCAAADSNNLSLAEGLLATGMYRDTVYAYADHRRFTPLIHAAQLGRLEMVRLLVKRGADVDRVLQNGVSALAAAAEAGQAEVVRFLLDRGARMDLHHSERFSPISLAIEGGHIEVVRLLLRSRGARDRIRSGIGRHECWSWPPALFKSLLPFLTDSLGIDLKADPSLIASLRERLSDGYPPEAIVVNAVTLAQAGAAIDFDGVGITALAAHAVAGDIEAMKRDIGEDNPRNMFREVTVNARAFRAMTALDWAILAGKPESVRFLAENGAELNPVPDVDIRNGGEAIRLRPLDRAFAKGEPEIIRILLEKGARVSFDSLSEVPHPARFVTDRGSRRGSDGGALLPLPAALVAGGHDSLLRRIAAADDPSFTSANLQVAFLIASIRGDAETAGYLLELRPELAEGLFHAAAIRGEAMGWRAFVFAAAFDHVAILDLILRKARPPADWLPILADALAYAERCGRKKATAFILRRRFGVAD